MKKLFFIFAAIMFIGTVNAADISTYVFTAYTWTATLNDAPANWTSGKDAYAMDPKGVQVTPAVSGANATSPVSFNNIKKIVVTYGSASKSLGSIQIKIGDNEAVSQSCVASADGLTLEYDYDETQSGYVTLTATTTNKSVYVKSITITYNYSASTPEINTLQKIDLGNVIIGVNDDGYAKDTAITVEGANLSAPIAVSYVGTHLSATENQLPAAGGTLHLHVASASALELADTVLLTSGETVAKIPVVATIKQNIALPGTAATMTRGTNGSAATVDGVTAVKVGTSSADGNLTITVPAYAEKLRFYAAAWNGVPGTIVLSAPAGVTLGAESLNLIDDAGISGGSTNYALSTLVPTSFVQEFTLSGVTAETEITVSSGTARRFVIWDAKCDLGEAPGPDPEPITDYTIHYLAKDDSELSNEVVTLNLPEAPAVTGFTFLYWRAVAGGNIADEGIKLQAVYEVDVPMSAPDVVVNPSNPAQKLIREGNVYILRDNRTFTTSGTLVR